MNTKRRPNIFFGWFIVTAALFILTIGYSIRYSFSIFYPYILNEFHWTRASTSLAFSINLLVYGISSPIVGSLVDRFGPRQILIFAGLILSAGIICLSQTNAVWQLYIIFGIVMAVGINCMGTATHGAYLPNWFVLRRGLAFGIMAAGVGSAQLVAGLYQHLISSLDWRGSLLVIAIFPLLVIPTALFVIKTSPQKMGLSADGINGSGNMAMTAKEMFDKLINDKKWASKDWTLTSALKTRRLWFLLFAFLCQSTTLNLIAQHQPIYCHDIGFSEVFASTIFSLFGIGMIVGTISGYISDRIGREVTFSFGALGSIIGILAIMFASQTNEWLLYVFAAFFGVFSGVIGPTFYAGSADLFAGRHYGAINGFTLLGFGIGGALGPWLGGYIFDTTGNYSLAFLASIIAVSIACILFWLAAPRKVRSVQGRARNINSKVIL